MLRLQAVNAQVPQPHRQILRRGRRIVRQKQERRARRQQGAHKVHRPGNQMILPVNDAVHIDQIASLHKIKGKFLLSSKPRTPAG